MLIDWFTVGAQLLNFLVLIWLLKRFLYQPILTALDARERRISAELAAADQKKLQAQAEQDEFIRKNQEFEQQRAELFAVAHQEVKALRQQLLEEARQEANNLRLKQQEALRSEQKGLITAVSRRAQTEVLAIARQALQDLADISLEQHIVTVFIEKLQLLDHSQKQQMLSAVSNSEAPLLVRSAFELSPAQQVEIAQAMEKTFSIQNPLHFSTSEYLISGIELSSDGHKFSWTVADYLGSLEKNLNEVLRSHVDIKSAPEPRAAQDDS